jgi:hypothetical protein
LERVKLPIARAVERVGGLQAQYAPTAYIGLWSRLDGFGRNDLTRALERRNVVQGTLMRATIHVVSARDHPLFARAIREARRAWWLQATRRRQQAASVEAAAKRVRSLLAEGPRRRSELVGELGLDGMTWNGVQMWIDLVRVPPSGTWEQRRADLYAAAEDWLGPSRASSEDHAIDHLVRRYLGGFGPASRKDVASFTGLPPKTLAPTLERLRLRRFRDERGGELIDLPRAPLPDPDTPAPPRFLGTWEAALLVHGRRTQVLPERYRPLVFSTKTPHSVPTFLLDGRVAGTWTEQRGHVKVEPFGRIPRESRRALDEEAERLSAFLA